MTVTGISTDIPKRQVVFYIDSTLDGDPDLSKDVMLEVLRYIFPDVSLTTRRLKDGWKITLRDSKKALYG